MDRAVVERVTVAGLLVVALAVAGCGGEEPGGAGERGSGPAAGVTSSPDSGPSDGAIPGPDSGSGDGGTGSPDSGPHSGVTPEPGSGPHSGVTPEPGSGLQGVIPDPGSKPHSGVIPYPGGGVTGRPGFHPPGGGGGEVGPQEVAWVPPGPGNVGPATPPDTGEPGAARWYEAFEDRDCDAIAKLGPERGQQRLYAGLGDACRAVAGAENRKNRWAAAEAALQHVDAPSNCLDRLALRLLRDLVVAHQRAPDAEIRITESPDGPGDACRGAPSTQVTPSR